MKVRFKFFICISVLTFVPGFLYSQLLLKDSAAIDKAREIKCLTETIMDLSIKDTLKLSAGKTIKEEVNHSGPGRDNILPVWLWILLGFLPGFIGGVLLIFLYSRFQIYSILANEKYKYLNKLKLDEDQNPVMRNWFKYIGIVGVLKKSKDEKKKAAGNLTNELARLKKQNDELIIEIGQKENKIADLKISADNKVSSTEQYDRQKVRLNGTQEKPQDLFFTIPESDGSFKGSNAKDWQDIDCFYRIVPEKNGLKGRLFFITGEYDLRALDNIDYYINPVCEIQNITDRSFARKILMTEPGRVVRRGETWMIEDNCKVKLKLV